MTNTIRHSTISNMSWQDKLSILNINNVHNNRTCEIFLMAERMETCSEVLEKICYGAQLDSLNVVQCMNFEDVLMSINYFSDDKSPPLVKGYDGVFKYAAKQAVNYLENDDVIPCKLIAYLIKLQIILMINQDVVKTQKQIQIERNLAEQRNSLIASMEDAKAGKGKGKGKGKKDKKGGGGKGSKGGASSKGSKKGAKGSKKSKGGKGSKGGAAGYDVCDSNNVIKPKPSSKLNKDNTEDLSYEKVDVSNKQLFIVITGFYEYDLIEELFKIGVPLTGILEIAKPDLTNTSSESIIKELEDENDEIEDFLTLAASPPRDMCVESFGESSKSRALLNFWTKFYERFENDHYPSFFESTFHMTINPSDLALSDKILQDQQYIDVFAEIGTEILKTVDIIRQHIHYIRNLKICDAGPKPRLKSSVDFKLYHKIMDMAPLDCCNIPFILYAVIEQVNELMSGPAKTTSTLNTESGIFLRGIPEMHTSYMHNGIKSFLTDVLNKNVNVHALFGTKPMNKYEHKYNPKIDFTISRKPFLIHEKNDLEIMIHPYEKISVEFVKICIRILNFVRPSLLWKGYPETNQQEQLKIISNRHDLQNMADLLNLPIHELQYAIHTIVFNSVDCNNRREKLIPVSYCTCCSCCSLEVLFPPCKDTAPKVETLAIPLGTDDKPLKNINFETGPEICVPHVKYLNTPNIYEARNISAYKWYENLSAVVMLQQLNKAEQDYLCLDYKYCSVDDTILLRYHNNLNKFGINRTTWDQSLRTPVALKEFCKYVVHDESSWLFNEEQKYIEEFEKEFEQLKKKDMELKQKYYPDLIFDDRDFIQPGSLKAKKIEELRRPKSTLTFQKDKKGKGGKAGKGKSKGSAKSSEGKKSKGGKDSKGKSKGSAKSSKGKKSKGGKDVKGKGAATSSQIGILEKLSQSTLPPERRKLTMRPAVEEPYSFFAYDLSKSRVQLTGSTIVFESQDGVKVTVDQARFFRAPDNISLNICMKGHSLILHHNNISSYGPFTFHFSLADHTVIVFGKPPKACDPEEKLAEKISKAIKHQRKYPENAKQQQLYFISEQQNHILKCFNIPYVSKRHLILSEQLIIPFLKQLTKRGIPTKLLPSKQTLKLSEINQFEDAVKSGSKIDAVKMKLNETDEKFVYETFSPKYTYGIISKTSSEANSENTSQTDESSTTKYSLTRSRKSLKSISSNLALLRKKSNRFVLHKIKKAMEEHLPIFKICSSRLHKYQYVKRVKSYMEVQVGPILKRLSIKPPFYRAKRNVEITKLLPVKPYIGKDSCKYNFRICLPSGLLIQNVPGIDQEPFHIRQKYLDMGPQCKNVAHESYRMFMRNGTILIKKCDGNVDVLCINSQMAYCDIPYLKVNSAQAAETTKNKKKECKTCKFGNSIVLHAHASTLTKFQKYLHRLLHRLRKHMVDGTERRYKLSHRACQRWTKNHITNQEQIYVLQDAVTPFTKFTLITSDGKKLRVTKKAIVEEKIYYTSTATDHRYEEVYFGREDGTHSILNRESMLITQFPDGTRITSWIEIAPQYLTIVEETEPEDLECFNNHCHKEQQTDVVLPNSETGSSLSCETSEEGEEEEEKEEEEEGEQEEGGEGEEEKVESMESTSDAKPKRKKRDDGSWVSIFVNFKYEHPNYATLIYYGMTNETEIILPNNVTLKASSKGEYTMDINETIHADVTTESVRLESQFCTSCMQKCISILNVKPLYDKLQLIPSPTELLRTTDSFNKIFMVNYDGKCFRNKKYHSKRANVVGCAYHDQAEHQKLFLLTRNLNGCKFWDVNAYRHKITKAKENPRSVIQEYGKCESENVGSTIIRTFVDKACDEKFVIPYLEPILILQKNKVKTMEPITTYYVTRQVINGLPGLSKLFPIYSVLVNLCEQRGVKYADPAGAEFSLFLNQITVENLKREERLLVEKIAKLEAARMVVESKKPLIPLDEKLRKWREKCSKYKGQIHQRVVPLYFHSAYDSFYKNAQSIEESLCSRRSDPDVASICSSSEDNSICSSSEDNSTRSTTEKVNKQTENSVVSGWHVENVYLDTEVDFDSSNSSKDESSNSSKDRCSTNYSTWNDIIVESQAKKLKDKSGDQQLLRKNSDKSFKSDPNKEHHPMPPERTVTLPDTVDIPALDKNPPEELHKEVWYESETAKQLLDEIKNRIVNIDKLAKGNEVQAASLIKVEFIVKRMFRNVMLASQSYNEEVPLDDYVTAAATAVVENVLEEEPTSLELNLLVKAAQKPPLKVMDSLCIPNSQDLSEYCRGLFKGVSIPPSTKSCPSDSAFDVYSAYADMHTFSKFVREPRIESETSCSALFEASQHRSKTSVSFESKIETVSKETHTATTSKLSSDADEKCKMCLVHSKFEKPQESSRSSQPSVDDGYPLRFVNLPSFTSSSSIRHDSSSSKHPSTDTYPAESASNVMSANFVLSPESSLLRYCMSEVSIHSENLAAVDGNSISITKHDLDRPESMMVLYSAVSLKSKDIEKPLAGPYIARNPNEILNKIIMTSKPPSEKQKLSAKNLAGFNKSLPETKSQKSLVSDDSLYNCRSCILRVPAKPEGTSDVKPTSLHSVDDAIKLAKSRESLSIDKNNIGPSLLNIYEECVKGPKKVKHKKIELDASINDEDAKILKSHTDAASREGIRSILTAHRVPRRKVVRRTLGTLTEPGTMDSKDQTEG